MSSADRRRAPSGGGRTRGQPGVVPADEEANNVVAVDQEDPGFHNQRRKRKRLNAVLDKITNHLSARNSNLTREIESDNGNNNNGDYEAPLESDAVAMFGRSESSPADPVSDAAATAAEPAAGPEGHSQSAREPRVERKPSNAALRREKWRDNQQQSVEEQVVRARFQPRSSNIVFSVGPVGSGGEVFKFDSFDRDRYLSGGSSVGADSASLLLPSSGQQSMEEEHETISPISGRSPHSSLSSPQVSVDSPRICFSPLRITDSIEEEDGNGGNGNGDAGLILNTLPKLSVRGCDNEGAGLGPHGSRTTASGSWLDPVHLTSSQNKLLPGFAGASLSRPISPNPLTPTTPVSPLPTPLHTLRHLPAYLTEIYRRRCLSDTDLSSGWEELHARNKPGLRGVVDRRTKDSSSPGATNRYLSLPAKGGSLESEASTASAATNTQESPLDLSVRSSVGSALGVVMAAGGSMDRLPQARGRGKAAHGSRRTAIRGTASMERYSLDRLDASPMVEAGAAESFVCPICGQMFSLSDRLAKHMASRHKSRSTDSGTKAYMCDVCRRSFARSDMLTRHMRLHTGVKPYTCRVCGQVFSRSDHLSTHQRTHTGEKPYRCPSCPYAACRRDMITRHMRTHARYDLHDSTGSIDAESPISIGSGPITSRSVSVESNDQPTPPMTATIATEKPPSPMDTEDEQGKQLC